jgi:hypothetical protein
VTSFTPLSGRSGAIALALVLFGILCFGIARPDVRPTGLMRDFNAFYCAGRAIGHGADPYRSEPLGRCEREPKAPPLLTTIRGLTMPAPLPPYALLPFILLAALPFTAAALVWACCIVASVALAVFSLRRATGVPLVPLVAALALTDGYASLCLGQVAPIAVAAIAVAAMFLRERRDEAAAFAAVVAMIEPHVGLPACIALFVWRRRTRLVLIGAAAGCALLSLAFVGIPTSIEYVRDVLPAHALSEVSNNKQLSLTYALHRLGVSDAIAVKAGECWYVAMLACGVTLARRVAKGTSDNAALAVIPPALALVGGPFVHIVQLAAVLPAAFVVYGHSSGNARRVAGFAIVMLAIPWIQFMTLGTLFVALAPLVAAVLAATLLNRRPLTIGATALLALLFAEQLTYAVTGGLKDPTPALLAHYNPRALAETSWTLYVRLTASTNVRAFDLARFPTLLGLVTFVCAVAAVALRPMKKARPRALRVPDWSGADAARRIATP